MSFEDLHLLYEFRWPQTTLIQSHCTALTFVALFFVPKTKRRLPLKLFIGICWLKVRLDNYTRII